jgi:ADP-ribose pyrophosphatase YjhB (NUDIX family)
MKRVKPYQFCMFCGGEVIIKSKKGEGSQREVCSKCGHELFHNSKPCVGALIVHDNRILLAKRNINPYKGWWDIPGGFLLAGEHPEDGIRREVEEETGLKIKPVKILKIIMDKYGKDKDDTLNIFYIIEVVGGKPTAGSDAGELRWFEKINLPKRIAFRCVREILKFWKEQS